MNSPSSGDDAGVDDGQPAVAVFTRDKNSGIGGATPSPLNFHRETVSTVSA